MTDSLGERLGLAVPVVQAGMGGGIAGPELAGAVSAAGGLGTIGMLAPEAVGRALRAARERCGSSPVAVNVLLPFARRAHWPAAAQADAVVTFWGRPRRRTPRVWIHQCGSVEEALMARDAGADGVIVQGIEAGGHVRGRRDGLELLLRARQALGAGYPLWLAGGVATGEDARRALDAGAGAVVVGTRFVATEESRAHREYKRRVVEGEQTVLTKLFSAGWPGSHRVLVNAAVRRWADEEGRVPPWLLQLNAATAPVLSRVPPNAQRLVAATQRPGRPILSPLPPVAGGPETLLEAGPLYAGTTVARVHDVRPAADVVAELAGR